MYPILSKKWPKINLSKKFNFLWNQLDAIVFLLFHSHNPPKKNTTKWPVVEQRQDQHEVRHVWSMGVLLFLLREIQMSTQKTWKYFTTKNVKRRLIFQTLSLISPKWFVFCLQFYVWLESCDQDGSFGHSLSVQCYEFYLHAILFL